MSPALFYTAAMPVRAETQRFVLLWLLSGVVLAIAMLQPAHRTQEARVLLTAQEMHDKPIGRAWLIPVCNGDIRLAKPPLAYWLSAIPFRLFGVNPIAGRIPMVLAAWLSIAVTFLLTRLFFGLCAGIFASRCTAGHHLDCPLRNTRRNRRARDVLRRRRYLRFEPIRDLRRRPIRSFASHIGDSPTAGWLASCGCRIHRAHDSCESAPALFILMFAIVLAVVARDARILTRFITSGAIVTLLVIALPWFWYVRTLPEAGPALQLEYDRLSGRGGHNESPRYYSLNCSVPLLPRRPCCCWRSPPRPRIGASMRGSACCSRGSPLFSSRFQSLRKSSRIT